MKAKKVYEAFDVLKGPSRDNIEESIKKFGRGQVIEDYLTSFEEGYSVDLEDLDKELYSYITNGEYYAFFHRGNSATWDLYILKADDEKEAFRKAEDDIQPDGDDEIIGIAPDGYYRYGDAEDFFDFEELHEKFDVLKGPSKEDFGPLKKYTKVSKEEAKKVMDGISSSGLTVETSYDRLVELFGEPTFDYTEDYSDGKVSTFWMVKDEKGNYASIYDWKETNLYYPGLPSVKKLRKQNSVNWHIGTKGGILVFPMFGGDEKENPVAYNLKLFIYFYES